MVTAETITDLQIVEMKERARAERDYETFTTCKIALREYAYYSERYCMKQRALCADILNARTKLAKGAD